jgi:hypothetical protein
MTNLAIVKIEFIDGKRIDTVVFRTNNLDEAWNYVHSNEGNLKIFDVNLNKKYKENK